MKIKLLIVMALFFSACNSEEGISSTFNTENSPLFKKYIVGKPNLAYFKIEKKVALRLGINLEYIFSGAKNRREIDKERLNIHNDNHRAYKFYSKKIGMNWEAKLKEEVDKERNK